MPGSFEIVLSSMDTPPRHEFRRVGREAEALLMDMKRGTPSKSHQHEARQEAEITEYGGVKKEKGRY